MAYYLGTYQECINYDIIVTQSEQYVHNDNWAEPRVHPNGTDFAIKKHEKYDAELTLVESLGDDWFPDVDI